MSEPKKPSNFFGTCSSGGHFGFARYGKPSRQADRDEAHFALPVGDKEQRRFLAAALQRLNFLRDIGGFLDRLLIDFHDHIAGFNMLFRGAGFGRQRHGAERSGPASHGDALAVGT